MMTSYCSVTHVTRPIICLVIILLCSLNLRAGGSAPPVLHTQGLSPPPHPVLLQHPNLRKKWPVSSRHFLLVWVFLLGSHREYRTYTVRLQLHFHIIGRTYLQTQHCQTVQDGLQPG